MCIYSPYHYNDVIMGAIWSQITSLTIVFSTVYSDADQRKHQSSTSQAFVRGIHRGPVNSPHKLPVTRKMFQFDDVIVYDALHGRWFYSWLTGQSGMHCKDIECLIIQGEWAPLFSNSKAYMQQWMPYMLHPYLGTTKVLLMPPCQLIVLVLAWSKFCC